MNDASHNCKSCRLVARRDLGDAPLWDDIYRTENWDVAHSYNVSLPGWLVLVSRRHIASVAELNEGEAAEVGALQRLVSKALADVVGCRKTYIVQFAEHPQHPHVHFHIAPIMPDHPSDLKGLRIFKLMGVDEPERVSEERMNEIGEGVRAWLTSQLEVG